jgi:hypothetical protein
MSLSYFLLHMFIQFFPYFLHIDSSDDTSIIVMTHHKKITMHRYHGSNKESNIKTATIHRHIDYNPISAVLQSDLSTTLRFPIHCCGIPARRTKFYLFIVHTEKTASNTVIEVKINRKLLIYYQSFSGNLQ